MCRSVLRKHADSSHIFHWVVWVRLQINRTFRNSGHRPTIGQLVKCDHHHLGVQEKSVINQFTRNERLLHRLHFFCKGRGVQIVHLARCIERDELFHCGPKFRIQTFSKSDALSCSRACVPWHTACRSLVVGSERAILRIHTHYKILLHVHRLLLQLAFHELSVKVSLHPLDLKLHLHLSLLRVLLLLYLLLQFEHLGFLFTFQLVFLHSLLHLLQLERQLSFLLELNLLETGGL
mmetsp:Transcript_41730/g.103683  ORF Transcript_41730/g.103683 Transcript_41730/m.103683 type:complete len:235 (-) Transcript_41730:342-1046(-)